MLLEKYNRVNIMFTDEEWKYLCVLMIIIIIYVVFRGDIIEGAVDGVTKSLTNASETKPLNAVSVQTDDPKKNKEINEVYNHAKILTDKIDNDNRLSNGDKNRMKKVIEEDTDLKLTKMYLKSVGLSMYTAS